MKVHHSMNFIKKKIKFPKKIDHNKLINYFKKYDLNQIVSAAKNINNKKQNELKISETYPPDLYDLYRLHQFIILNKRLTVLEFGTGWSSIILNHALKINKKNYFNLSKNLRKSNKFELHILDNEKNYLDLSKKRVSRYFKKTDMPVFYHSKCKMVLYNGQLATEYNSLPHINPDFIYLDGPDQFKIGNKLFGINTGHTDYMPMSCDIIKFENFLVPGTIIIVDGRTANSRFLINNFKRNWDYYFDDISDQNIFFLNEKNFGEISKKQINFYINK